MSSPIPTPTLDIHDARACARNLATFAAPSTRRSILASECTRPLRRGIIVGSLDVLALEKVTSLVDAVEAVMRHVPPVWRRRDDLFLSRQRAASGWQFALDNRSGAWAH